jgi:hypothetical protein
MDEKKGDKDVPCRALAGGRSGDEEPNFSAVTLIARHGRNHETLVGNHTRGLSENLCDN